MSNEMLMRSLNESAAAGNLSTEQHEQLVQAVQVTAQVTAIVAAVKAFDWTTVLNLLSKLALVYPPLGIVVEIARMVLELIKNLPTPGPVPDPSPFPPSPIPIPDNS